MQNLIQVSSLNMQQQQQMVGASLGGNGGLGMNMGGVLIDNRFASGGQMPQHMDFNYSNDKKLQRPSTNKIQQD